VPVLGDREIPVSDAATGATPRVRLLDARAWGLDESGLRTWARSLTKAAPTRCSSRSYRYPLALVAMHDAAVGVDIERIEHCEQAFTDSISTPAERTAGERAAAERVAGVLGADRDRFTTSLWSSKEALAKVLGDALAYDPRHLEGPGRWPDGRSGPWRAATLDVGAGHVAWLCWHVAAGT
jgi:hypothetical protein